MHLEYGVVFAFWTVRVFEDVEGVAPVAGAAADVADGVFDVGEHLVDLHIKIILKEELADMREFSTCERAVLVFRPAGEDFSVDVGRTAGVVPREDRGKPRYTMGVCFPSAAEPLFVVVRTRKGGEEASAFTADLWFLVNEMRSRVGMAGVVACGVGLPDVDEDVGKGFAGVDVDDADVEVGEEADLVFGDVLADGVAGVVVVGAFGYDGCENTGIILYLCFIFDDIASQNLLV